VAGSFVAPRGGKVAAAAAAAAAAAVARAPREEAEEGEEDAIGRGGGGVRDRWLAQAGMVLRDPPSQHLLAAAVVGRLHRCVDERVLPRADLALGLLLQLLQLGVDARRQLRDRRYRMPPVPARALGGVWPQLVDALAEGALEPAPDDEEKERAHSSEEGWQVRVLRLWLGVAGIAGVARLGLGETGLGGARPGLRWGWAALGGLAAPDCCSNKAWPPS
jgi:hypothetical protein